MPAQSAKAARILGTVSKFFCKGSSTLKMQAFLAATLLLLVAAGPTARATLVLLGDSLSDAGQQGNIPVAATGGLLPGTTLVNERLSTGQVGSHPIFNELSLRTLSVHLQTLSAISMLLPQLTCTAITSD